MGWLADLRDKAGKACDGEPWPPTYPYLQHRDEDFIAACSPERVQALCKVCQLADEYLAQEESFGCENVSAKPLLGALAELERFK